MIGSGGSSHDLQRSWTRLEMSVVNVDELCDINRGRWRVASAIDLTNMCFRKDLPFDEDVCFKRLADEATTALRMKAFQNGAPEMLLSGLYVNCGGRVAILSLARVVVMMFGELIDVAWSLTAEPTQVAVAAPSRDEVTVVAALPGKVRLVCDALETYGCVMGQKCRRPHVHARNSWAWSPPCSH